jgi:FkbM family methyltransferase
MGLSHRIDLGRAYFSHERDFDCSLRDLLGKLLRPTCSILAQFHISKIVNEGAFKRIYLRGIRYPLFWPSNITLYYLYTVISESLYEDDWHYYEVPETQVKPGDVVLDCGAAEGLFSLATLARAKRIIIVEPSPLFIESLNKTFQEAGNVQILPCALSSQTGRGYLSSGILNSVLTDIQNPIAEGAMTINTTTIDHLVDDLGLTSVDYIKGDLESHEFEVLKGAARTIEKHRPKIAITTYHQGNNWKEIRDLVLSLVPDYAWRVKGLSYLYKSPKPVMIHFWPT